MFPCIIETRLTYDHGAPQGMHCDYPLGLFTSVLYEGQRVEVDRGKWPIYIQLGFKLGWAALYDVTGQPMTKIRLPENVEDNYRKYTFYSYGKLYVLEFRFDHIEKSKD